MNFSENISLKLTELITKELNYNDDKKEIIAYAIETALLFILGFLFLILLGYYFNVLIPTIIAAISGGFLRRVSGGAHFNTPLKCLSFGSIVYTSIGVLANALIENDLINEFILILSLLVSLILVVFLAPVDSESKPIYSKSLKLKLKILSIVFVILSILLITLQNNKLISVSVVLGVVYQCLTLLPIFNKKRW